MALPIVTHRPIACDVLTVSYRAVGSILTPVTGLLALWNNPMNSFMEMEMAHLSRMHMPSKEVERVDSLRLVKRQVIAVCLGRREDLGPTALARGGFTKSLPYPVFITTQVYEMSGTLEWAGRFDFSAIMTEGTNDFLALYNVTIRAILIPSVVIQSPAVILNRRQVDMMALTNLKPPEQPAQPAL